VWRRVLDVLGLEPLREKRAHQQHHCDLDSTSTAMDPEAAEAMGAPAPAPPAVSATGRKTITILDLPSETQKDIFKHVSVLASRLEWMRQIPGSQC